MNPDTTSITSSSISDANNSPDDILREVQISIQLNNFKRAINYQELLLQVYCDLYGHDDINTLRSMYSLAGLLVQEDISHIDDSEDLYIRTMVIIKSKAEYSTDVAYMELLGNCMLALGSLIENHYKQDRLDEALQFYSDALKTYRQMFTENHPRTADALLHLASVYTRKKEYELAKVRCEQAYKIFMKIDQESLASIVCDTLNDIIRKHVRYLHNEDYLAEASVMAEQLGDSLATTRGCPLISGYVWLDTDDNTRSRSNSRMENTIIQNDRTVGTSFASATTVSTINRKKAYMAIFPSLNTMNDENIVHMAWCNEELVNDSDTGVRVWKAVRSIFEDTRIGRLLSIGSSNSNIRRNRSNSVKSDLSSIMDVDLRYMDMTLTSAVITRDNIMNSSFSVGIPEGGYAGCIISGNAIQDSIPNSTNHSPRGRKSSITESISPYTRNRTRSGSTSSIAGNINGRERSSSVSMNATASAAASTMTTAVTTTIWLETLEDAQNWCDALQPYIHIL